MPPRKQIERLPPQFSESVDFEVYIDRVGKPGELPITLTVTKPDFGTTLDVVAYQIRAAAPDLRVTATIEEAPDQNGNGGIEQGESAVLTVQTTNDGDMDAKNVVIQAATSVDGVLINRPWRTLEIVRTGQTETIEFTISVGHVDIPFGKQSFSFQ